MASSAQQPPDYDKLYQVQSWVSDQNSPLQQHLKKVMTPYDAKFKAMGESGKMTMDQYQQAAKEYNQIAAQEMMKWMHSQFAGGKIPDASAAQEFDYARRQQKMLTDPQFKGSPEDVDKAVRSGEPAYGNAYAVLKQVQDMIPQPNKSPTLTRPAESTNASIAPRPKPGPVATPGTGGPLTDDEKLSDTQLRLLEGLSMQAAGTNDNHMDSYDEADAPKNDPASFLNVGMPASAPQQAAPSVGTGAGAPADNARDKAIMDNLKKMLLNEDDKNSYDQRFGK